MARSGSSVHQVVVGLSVHKEVAVTATQHDIYQSATLVGTSVAYKRGCSSSHGALRDMIA